MFNSTLITITFKSRYVPLDECVPKIPIYNNHWPRNWPQRLLQKPESQISDVDFKKDTDHWNTVVSNQYLQVFGINWSGIRNVMDMNARYGGYHFLNPKLSLLH